MNSYQISSRKYTRSDILTYNNSYKLSQKNVFKNSVNRPWRLPILGYLPDEYLIVPMSIKFYYNIQALLRGALNKCGDKLKCIAEQSSMTITVSDRFGTIIWNSVNKPIKNSEGIIDSVNEVLWKEELIENNHLIFSSKYKKSDYIFINKCYISSLQNQICYTAPINDPCNKNLIGIVDLSITKNNYNNLGNLAAESCAILIQNIIQTKRNSHLYIQTFTKPKVLLDGKELVVSPRQIEILTILSLHPDGLNLDSLHYLLYGEKNIKIGTLKTEISQLRRIFGNNLKSRPYRLSLTVEGDFLSLETALNSGEFFLALQLYTGIFLDRSESPFLCRWRNSIELRIIDILFKIKDKELILNNLSFFLDVIDSFKYLVELLPAEHPVRILISN